jgi:hypothetical protein
MFLKMYFAEEQLVGREETLCCSKQFLHSTKQHNKGRQKPALVVLARYTVQLCLTVRRSATLFADLGIIVWPVAALDFVAAFFANGGIKRCAV